MDLRLLRYHDGEDWTASVARLGLRGPGPVEQRPLTEDTSDEDETTPSIPTDPEIAALPRPPRVPMTMPEDYARRGWFSDPDASAFNLKTARFHDGEQWTDFVCETGPISGPGEITRRPMKTKRWR
jgi:hypothetical protein